MAEMRFRQEMSRIGCVPGQAPRRLPAWLAWDHGRPAEDQVDSVRDQLLARGAQPSRRELLRLMRAETL